MVCAGLKQGKFFILIVTAKPKVLENLAKSWKKSWNLKSSNEYDPGRGWGGVLPVMKYIKGQRNLSFQSVKRPKRLTDSFFGCGKVKNMFWFSNLFKTVHLQQLNRMQNSKLGK